MRPIWILSFLLLGGLPLTSQAAPETTLPVSEVRYHVHDKEQVLDGVVEAIMQSTVSAQVAGRITEINFDVDDLVEKGAVIARIRDQEYKARLQQAEANLREALAQHKDARLAFNRAKDMFQKKVVSASDYDRSQAALKASEARVAAAKAAVSEAREQLANTVIRAPYSGVVVKRHVEVGETVRPGQAVMTGLSLDKLRVSVDVPQGFINAIRRQQAARIQVGQRLLPSTGLTIFPYADPRRHTFKVRARLPEGVRNLYPGMLVKVAFKIGEEQVLSIPAAAVVQRSEVSAVYVMDDNGRIRLRQLRLGRHDGDRITVLAGLEVGERIVLDPVAAGIRLKQAQEGSL